MVIDRYIRPTHNTEYIQVQMSLEEADRLISEVEKMYNTEDASSQAYHTRNLVTGILRALGKI